MLYELMMAIITGVAGFLFWKDNRKPYPGQDESDWWYGRVFVVALAVLTLARLVYVVYLFFE